LTIKFFFIFFIFFSSSAFSTNIRVLDFQKVVENNINISRLYDQINKDQEYHNERFKKEELNLQNEVERIEKLKLILNNTELEKEIENYNKKLIDFNDKIEKFNLHYELQINSLKNKIITLILEELRNYSEANEIDLILDSNNYILSTNSINITNLIEDQVNKKKIEINFEKY
jgi:Skp family chaperone for outer membrane proteins